MGQNPDMVEEVTRWVVEVANGAPVWAKMTPNITDIRMPAAAARREAPTVSRPSIPSWPVSASI